MLRNRIQMYPGMYQPSPISNQYYQQRDKNDSVQNQMDIAKKAFEEENTRSKTLADQKEQLERDLRDARHDAQFQNKLHKQKSKMIADIESTRSQADELRTKNEQLQITDDIAQLNHQLQSEQATRKELEHRVREHHATIDKNSLHAQANLTRRENDRLNAEVAALEEIMRSEEFKTVLRN